MTALTLTELCTIIAQTLDEGLARTYWVKAEISSLSTKGGHLYLELIDGKSAKMRATCWSGTQEMLMAYFESETGHRLSAGMSILIDIEVQYHALYGLSLNIIGIDPRYTIGDIARQRQQTIAQLQADGLMEAQQLLPLPTLIRRIAVISSESAAGYQDFKHQLDHSPYHFHTCLYGAVMQGEGAERSIIAALETIAQDADQYDAVAIIRGGGAVTDLSCFDRYTLCAVCAQFELPILSGIGHTRDISVLDLVAHQSLKTPTAVAEWLIHRMDDQSNRIADLMLRLRRTAEHQILIRQHRIELLEQRILACNPERIYRMGYSLLTKDGVVVRSVADLRRGDQVQTHLIDGTITLTTNG